MSSERIAVVGGGIGGLSTAIHLAVDGFDVTLLEANEKVGGRANVIERDGFKFDTGPSLLNYPAVFDEMFRLSGSSLRDELDLIRIDPAIRFIWPDDETFQLSSDLTTLSTECGRFNDQDPVGLFKFFRDAHHKYRVSFDRLVTQNVDSPFKWFVNAGLSNLFKLGLFRSMDSQLGLHFKSQRIREAFGSYGMYLGGAPYDLPGIFSIIPFGELEYGLWLPKGGMYSLVEAMERTAIRLGVEIRTETRVVSIQTRDRRVTGVTYSDGSFEDFNVVVSNVDVPTTMQRLLSDSKEKGYKLPRMTPGVITYYIAVDRDLENLNHHTVFMPEDPRLAYRQLTKEGRVPDDLPFYVSVASNSDPSLAPPGKSAMFLLAPVPRLSQLPDVVWSELAESLKRRMIRRINEYGVKLSEDDFVWEESWSPVEWTDMFGLHDGSAFGAAHNLRQIGPFRDRNYSSEFRGLFFAGASTTPGTGGPMCVLSGKMAAKRVRSTVRDRARV